MRMSKHASKRMQQRSISPHSARLVMDYGRSIRRHGADVWALDKSGRRELKGDLGVHEYKQLEPHLDVYVVANDDTIITVGKRLRRLKH